MGSPEGDFLVTFDKISETSHSLKKNSNFDFLKTNLSVLACFILE